MRVRKISVLTLTAVTVGLALTACDTNDADKAAPSTATSTSAATSTPQSPSSTAKTAPGSAHSKPSGTPRQPGVKCTDQINYVGDPRSNAEINTIGEETGYCPPVQHQ